MVKAWQLFLLFLILPLLITCSSDDDDDNGGKGCSGTCDRRVEQCDEEKESCEARSEENREGKSAESIAAVERCVDEITACEQWRDCVSLLEEAESPGGDTGGGAGSGDVEVCQPEGGPWLCCHCRWTGCNSQSATISRTDGPDGPAQPIEDCCAACAAGPGPFDSGCAVVSAAGSEECG